MCNCSSRKYIRQMDFESPLLLWLHKKHWTWKWTNIWRELRQLVAGFPPRRPGFNPRSSHMGFVVDKVALGQVFSKYFSLPCRSSFHRWPHINQLLSGAGTIDQLETNILTPPQETKNGVGSILEILPKFFAWKRLDACRNVKRNKSFMYRNTFITKLTDWINYKRRIMWVTKWSCSLLGTSRLALGGLLAIRVYIHRLRHPASRCNSRLARHTRCLRFAALP
jgi:hypothetical protein